MHQLCAVGHLPVIRPGEAFEYRSGCELHTLTGTLSGSFYMTEVDDVAESCQIGDPTIHLSLSKWRCCQ
jgi:ApaG protein